METEADQSVEVNEQPWNAVELDRALSPIRRTVQWVLAEPGRIGRLKHAEATLSPGCFVPWNSRFRRLSRSRWSPWPGFWVGWMRWMRVSAWRGSKTCLHG